MAKKVLTAKKAFENRVKYTVIAHVIAIVVFFLIYAVPEFLEYVRSTDGYRAGRRKISLGVVFLILHAVVATFIWSGDLSAEAKGNLLFKKVKLSLWFIFNLVISLIYLILIDNFFTGRFF